MTNQIVFVLNEPEAEWLTECLTLVNQLSHHWDRLPTEDYGRTCLAKIHLAIASAYQGGIDPDEWLRRRRRA